MNLTIFHLILGNLKVTGGLMKKSFFLISLLSSTVAFSGSENLSAIQRAEEAFLNLDGSTMVSEARSALKESHNHPLIVGQVASLFKSARSSKMRSDFSQNFQLPKDVTYLDLEIQRRYRTDKGEVVFALNASIGINKQADLEQLQVIRYPDEVMLDKAAGIGNMHPEESDTEKELWMGGNESTTPVQEGLFLINLKLKGEAMVRGYVIMVNKNASASPVVLTPVLKERIEDATPTISWKGFLSPEYKEGERIANNILITEVESGKDVMVVRVKDPKATSFTVGDKEAAKFYQGVTELVPGKYRMRITHREVEDLGVMKTKRTSTTIVPFTIK